MKPSSVVGHLTGKFYSVGELTAHIKALMEGDELLGGVWVQGEVSNLVRAASGHQYFTLKDGKAVLRAALWAGNRRRIAVEFKNGDHVLAFGSISVYEARGEYQLLVTDLRSTGIGALYEAFEKLKQKLSAEGLFEEARKIPLPFLPRGVGIVTSPKGAVVQDVFRVVRRRYPDMPLYLVPVKVQGEGAAAEVVTAIARLDRDPRVDVIIVARGGGSLEDLWAFNEEVVARAIAAASTPIVSAIGHETDTTIADFVADRRAATPSVAGELVVPVKADLVRNVAEKHARLGQLLRAKVSLCRERLGKARACRFLRKPALLVAERRMLVANLTRELEVSCRQRFQRSRHTWELLTSRLTSLNPRSLLRRGYLLAEREDGTTVVSVRQVEAGSSLRLHFADGRAGIRVETVDLSSQES